MQVVKRDGRAEDIDFGKIHRRIGSLCCKPQVLEFQKEQRPEAYEILHNLPPILHANVDLITKKTFEGVYNNIPTTEIDKLSAEIAQEMCTIHPDNSTLASRILISNLQKNVLETMLKRFPNVQREEISKNLFKYVMTALYFNLNKKGEHSPLVSPYIVAIAHKYSEKVNQILDFSRDFLHHDYLSIKTLENGYLLAVYSMENFSGHKIILETPSISDLRITLGLCCAPIPSPDPFEKAVEFISKHAEVIRKGKSTENITCYKDTRVNSKLFKKLYWEYMLEEEIKNVNVEEKVWQRILDVYEEMSKGRYTPATPCRFNSGCLFFQGSSCFLIAMESDSLKGIYNTLAEQAQISKHAGGVGLWVHNIRSTNSYISGTNGVSNGLKPMLQVFDATSKYVDQSGKRPGSAAIYLEVWHLDIMDFLQLKLKKGSDANRARRLFYALWICDEFFRCLKEKKDWYLFDPATCPKLYDSYDEGFSTNYLSDEYVKENKERFLFTYRYRKYVRQNKFEKKISCVELMEAAVETIRDSGVPYMLCKDAANRKSNQKNLGVIKSSNLCAEIIQYSDENETSVCNLHSVCLNTFTRKFVEGTDNENFKYDISLIDGVTNYYTFDFEEFAKVVRICQNNIDRLIDINFYPTEKARRSNMRQRNIGIGVQAEADLLAFLKIAFNGKDAQKLRFYIFERMYYECLKASVELAKEKGPYETFKDSPASLGKLHFDMCRDEGQKISYELSLPWDELKRDIQKYGLRNSLFIALMPTVSTSSICGGSPSFEPFNSLVYVKKSGAGDITIFNKNLVQDLMSLNLWTKPLSDKILENHGSIQSIVHIPKKLRDAYLTVYDMEPKHIIDAAFVRSWFVDQSQSMNLFFKNVTMTELSKAFTHGWARGLKTLSYYSRTRPASSSQKAQIEKSAPSLEGKVCSRDDPDCLSCGS